MHRAAAVVVLALVLPTTAHAIKLGEARPGLLFSGAELRVSETFYYKFNLELDDDADDARLPAFPLHEFVSRTNLDLRVKKFSMGVQFDLVAVTPDCTKDSPDPDFGGHPDCVRGEGWDEDAPDTVLARLEKIYFRYRSPHFDLDVGDFYAAFGRGIVLSLVKLPEIDLDTSLLGVRVDLRGKSVDLTMLGGITNPQEVSMELRNLDVDKTEWDVVVGANLKMRPHRRVEATLHGVGYNLQDVPSTSFGGTFGVNNVGDALDLFIEGDGFLYGAGEGGGPGQGDVLTPGYAIYASGTTYAGPLTLLIELKRYKNAKLDALVRNGPVVPTQFVKPPTLEYEAAVTDDVQKSLDSNDIVGWRAQGDLWFLDTDTTVSFSLAHSFDLQEHPGYSPQREMTIHPMLTLEQPLHLSDTVSLHLKGSVGYRHDFPIRSPDGDEDQFLPNAGLLHYRADIGVTAGKHAFELVSTFRRHAFTLPDEVCWLADGETVCDKDDGYVSVENALSYTLMGKYTLAVHLDYTDRIQDQTGALAGIGNLSFDPEFIASTYIGGELILKPVENLEVYVFWGSQKSGIVCTGGACRTVPAFTGVKSRVSVNF